MEGGSSAVDTKYKALEYLLSQSKLYSTIMLQQMTQQEDAETAKDEKSKQRAAKKEEKAEQAAAALQKRTTRKGAVEEEEKGETKELPRRGRGRPAKNTKTEKSGKISDYLSKKDLEEKAGQASISEALAEETKEDVKPGDIGMQNLRSAKQPDLVTGGLMRTYQLEGPQEG